MNYEWKARLLIGFFCLLLGLTLGSFTGEEVNGKLFIYVIDFIFIVAIIRFVYVTYKRVNRIKYQQNAKPEENVERDSY